MENIKWIGHKPIDGHWGTHVYIRDIVVEEAIKRGVGLEITIPAGTAVVDPVAWQKRGDIMRKIFKDPLNPMLLYGGFVPIPENERKTGKKVTTKTVTVQTVTTEEEQTQLF